MKDDNAAVKAAPSLLVLSVSALTHVLLVWPVIYVVVLSAIKYSFFSWHPICTTVGVCLLMTEAVFGISGEAYLNQRLSRRGRVTLHWVLHTLGLGLTIAGFAVIVVNKSWYNKDHFMTTHGQLGLSAVVVGVLVAISGIPTQNANWLYPRVSPVLLKVIHGILGIAATILLLAATINGIYLRWWPGSEVGRDLVFASFVLALIFLLAKPVLGAASRSRLLWRRSTRVART
ncbi:cytochrome b561 domain-containing protein 2 [Orussus abietinus]|uniref:cytochrome b561 domain-containing protein 2 n=1 Tax=Orussus abietinus TaxID=222816 RepID=UPI0006269D39|nr:cytochrome b561 domain-containing protein 2 [Orussus abietinus]XP_012280124.1 cytochrome b561 domain-containing protein 2 [Orussus abietinus]